VIFDAGRNGTGNIAANQRQIPVNGQIDGPAGHPEGQVDGPRDILDDSLQAYVDAIFICASSQSCEKEA
jgi:hypothetical protein